MTMIERVARAIGCQMDHCWDRDTDRCSVCLDTARAAIAAIEQAVIEHGDAELMSSFGWFLRANDMGPPAIADRQ
jgi:hypothetical protein